MAEKFTVRPNNKKKKEDNHEIISLRIEKEMLKEFEGLAKQSGRSRNNVMCLALRYALDHLEFIPDNEKQ